MASENSYIGSCFGNYQITDEIDCGSFGCVYRAQHAFLSRVAAVKLLHAARLLSRGAHDKFLQEAQLLEKLKHPHILSIYDFGIVDGLPYIVTEYASGGSLRDLIRRRAPQPLPLGEAISILSQVGDALYYAHQQGIIHHDLKPENILLNSRGEILLADFGIAIVRTTATLEQLTEMNGTPAYMAPEQFQGKVSRRSDQYSLGCIAYELVTGRLPFIAPDALSMGLKHMQQYPILPTQLNPGLPSQIEHIILKALEKRSVNRYPDVLAFIEELQAFSLAKVSLPPADRTNSSRLLQKTKEQLLNEGIEFSSLKQYQEALLAFEQALRLDPYFADASFGRGNVLYYLGHYEEALAAIEWAIRLDPGNAALYNNKGCVLYALGRFREALMAYEQALRLDPRLVNALTGKNLTIRQLRGSR
jgi:serine/threonine protein kinase